MEVPGFIHRACPCLQRLELVIQNGYARETKYSPFPMAPKKLRKNMILRKKGKERKNSSQHADWVWRIF
jgi:hypothetical protein